jgi:Protein of unknown function (DUF3102)
MNDIGHNQPPASVDEELKRLAGEINARSERIHKTIRKTAEQMIAAGRLLLEAKELVRHGEFKKWIADNLHINYRSAASWMKAASLNDLQTNAGGYASRLDLDMQHAGWDAVTNRDMAKYDLYSDTREGAEDKSAAALIASDEAQQPDGDKSAAAFREAREQMEAEWAEKKARAQTKVEVKPAKQVKDLPNGVPERKQCRVTIERDIDKNGRGPLTEIRFCADPAGYRFALQQLVEKGCPPDLIKGFALQYGPLMLRS